jgi:hypothetical protein
VLWLVWGADCGAEFFVKLQLHQRAEIRVDQLAGDFGLEPYEWALPVKFSESVILAAQLVEVFDGSGILWEECGSGFDGAHSAFRFVVEGSLAGVAVSRAFHAIEEGQALRVEIGQRLIDDGVVGCDEEHAASGEKQAEKKGEQGTGTSGEGRREGRHEWGLGDYQFAGSVLPAASAPDWIPLRMHVR